MCGIAALFEPSAPDWLPEAGRRMSALIAHRGPDGDGLACFDRAGSPLPASTVGATFVLAHRRLSILDLSPAGAQPMSDANGRQWIIFNGEIYNYLELRAELSSLGHHFHTGTDTETILAAYAQWGEACLSRLNGMFAFVLLDRSAPGGRVFAARDRFGEKPFYLWPTPDGGLALASEIKAFTAHPRWRARLAGQTAYDFLNWGITDHGPGTLFAGVSQLRGGEFILSSLEALPRARPQTWYKLEAAPFDGDLGAAGARFSELLVDSVRLRLRADVPVGSCLSGGLDSSAIVCTMRDLLENDGATRTRQNTFSAYSDVARFDERRHVEAVVRHTGATAHNLVPDPARLLEELDALVWHQDEPFGSTSIFAQWCVYRQARERGVVVMLDGQGADEALGGYQGYFAPRLAGLLARGQLIAFARESAALRRDGLLGLGMQARYLANEFLPGPLANGLRKLAGRTVNAPDFIDIRRLGAEPRSPHSLAKNRRDPVRALCRAQLISLNLPMLLHWADRDSMAHGVEARLPFLDHRLVEFCLGLPEEHKISDGWTKRVLREGLRGRMPESVRLRRDKLGFATAEEVWMRERHRGAFAALVDEAIDRSGGILTSGARAKAIRMLEGQEPFSFLVWRFISFGRWMKRFDVAPPTTP